MRCRRSTRLLAKGASDGTDFKALLSAQMLSKGFPIIANEVVIERGIGPFEKSRHCSFNHCQDKFAMEIARMNDHDWVNCLTRAKLSQKYPFHAIQILAPLRNEEGVAPVVLQTSQEYLRAPAHTEA